MHCSFGCQYCHDTWRRINSLACLHLLPTNYIRRVHKSSLVGLTPVDNFWVIPLSSENTWLKDQPWYDIEDCCCTDDICWKLLDWEDENCCCMNCCCCCCCIICTCLLLLLLCSLCPDLKKHEKAFINFFGCIALKVWFLLALTYLLWVRFSIFGISLSTNLCKYCWFFFSQPVKLSFQP